MESGEFLSDKSWDETAPRDPSNKRHFGKNQFFLRQYCVGGFSVLPAPMLLLLRTQIMPVARRCGHLCVRMRVPHSHMPVPHGSRTMLVHCEIFGRRMLSLPQRRLLLL